MEYIQYEITEQNLEAYKHNMMENEKSLATIEKYLRDVRSFCRWNQGEVIVRTRILGMEKSPCPGICSQLCEFYAGGTEWIPEFSGMAGAEGKAFSSTEAAVPRSGKRSVKKKSIFSF